MSDDKDRLIFSHELSRLHSDYERCKEIRIKEEILKEIHLLKKAIKLLLEGEQMTFKR
ncbi:MULTISPECIES: hypothetical protein [Bacillaceae]|uniref:hypothetical protein n=1 Tax=Bacillaceae TaxID=186817 RepID=UPI000362B531|nr:MULTISPECIES: hypothetical protein [Bacillaceae]